MSNKSEMTFYFVKKIPVKSNEYPIVNKYCDRGPTKPGGVGHNSQYQRQTRQSVVFL